MHIFKMMQTSDKIYLDFNKIPLNLQVVTHFSKADCTW